MKQSFVNTVIVALWSALIVTGLFMVIPIPGSPVPIVLQNMLAVMAGLVLGPLNGSMSVLLFLVAGALGLPVFSGARGGLAVLAGPTGGYLFGYVGGALLAGLIAGKPKADKVCPFWKCAVAALLGMLFVYIPGLLRLSLMFQGNWTKTLAAGFLPYIAGDLAKAVLMTLIAPALRKFYVHFQQYGSHT